MIWLQAQPNAIFQFLPLILIVLVMYVFFIRPQAKKQKEQKKFIDELSKGKEVVTNSGIIGKIIKLSDNEITLQVDQKSQLRLLRSMVSKELTESLTS